MLSLVIFMGNGWIDILGFTVAELVFLIFFAAVDIY
uniref:Uncharacterized protein n=1 Tax=Moniliophthora roreri TaxID=221103 RepID=A0A0W0FWU6_MONRR